MKLRFDIKQNTEEWDAIRVGKITASVASDLLMDKKNKGYQKLIDKLVEERMTGKPTESRTFQGNEFTERGHELEPVARDNYEMESFQEVKIIGVIELNDLVLCSPDGLINDDGLWQAKCPIFNTQKGYLKNPKVPTNYYKQMQFELFVSGREYNIFYSYHPSLPPVEIKVERDEEMIKQIRARVKEAIEEVNTEIKYLKGL